MFELVNLGGVIPWPEEAVLVDAVGTPGRLRCAAERARRFLLPPMRISMETRRGRRGTRQHRRVEAEEEKEEGGTGMRKRRCRRRETFGCFSRPGGRPTTRTPPLRQVPPVPSCQPPSATPSLARPLTGGIPRTHARQDTSIHVQHPHPRPERGRGKSVSGESHAGRTTAVVLPSLEHLPLPLHCLLAKTGSCVFRVAPPAALDAPPQPSRGRVGRGVTGRRDTNARGRVVAGQARVPGRRRW